MFFCFFLKAKCLRDIFVMYIINDNLLEIAKFSNEFEMLGINIIFQ